MGLFGGGGGSSETTSETLPYGPARKNINQILRDVRDWYSDTDYQFFPDQTYADFDPTTERAFAGIEETAAGPSLSGQAAGYLGDVLGGSYLPGQNQNPFVDAMRASIREPALEAFREEFMPGLQNKWISALGGATPGMVQEVGREARQAYDEIGRREDDLMGRIWENERQRMQGAAGMAPGVEAGTYTPWERLRGVGAEREAQDQRRIDEEMARFEFNQRGPIPKASLAWPFSMAAGTAFPYTTTETEISGSDGLGQDILGGLGLGLSGLSMAGGLGWRPFSAGSGITLMGGMGGNTPMGGLNMGIGGFNPFM